jgi:hypothetical protein
MITTDATAARQCAEKRIKAALIARLHKSVLP